MDVFHYFILLHYCNDKYNNKHILSAKRRWQACKFIQLECVLNSRNERNQKLSLLSSETCFHNVVVDVIFKMTTNIVNCM
jgi:hypothetical protein